MSHEASSPIDPRLQSLLKREREGALGLGLGGLVFFAAGVLVVGHHLLHLRDLLDQLGGIALGLVAIAMGIGFVHVAVQHRPEDNQALRWITTERDKVVGWRILPGSGVGAMDTKVILCAKKGEDAVLVLVRGREAPVLDYLTEHLPCLDR